MESLDILGCRLDAIDADEATLRTLDLARDGNGAQVVTLGTEMVVHAQKDTRFRAIVNASALSLCDTVGLLAVARRRGAHVRERVTGVELIDRVCQAAAREGIPIYCFGGAPGVAADAGAILEARFPGLIVAGEHNGFLAPGEDETIAAQIRAGGAKILFVGLGFPRQEYWIAQYGRATGAGVAIGVGGSFDVISGRVTRAPLLWRKLSLEWLYRLIREPHRWRRQLALPAFVWLIVLDALGVRRTPQGDSM